MKLTPEEVAEVKTSLANMAARHALSLLSPEDRRLALLYPKHTLAAARLIDSAQPVRAPLRGHIMHDCGEDFMSIQHQETGTYLQS